MHNEDDKIQFYWAFVPNSFQYDAVSKTIAKGLSFCQTTDVYEEYQDMTGMTSEMGNINRWKVTMLVWIFCAESLQRIAEAMNFCWAFAIALDEGNKASVPYLDIWIHFVLGHELLIVPLIACPMYESHTEGMLSSEHWIIHGPEQNVFKHPNMVLMLCSLHLKQ